MKAVFIHPIGYEDRPRGHEPDHFRDIQERLALRGHAVLPQSEIINADVLFFDSDVWNLSTGGTSPYDWTVLNVVLQKRLPVVWFDHFDHAGSDVSQGRWPGSDDWKDLLNSPNDDYARFGHAMSRVCPILYFMRKMQWHQTYPEWVKPLEYPLFEDHPLVSKEELAARPFDVCGLANIALPRAMAMIGLYRDARLKVDCEIVPHYRRLDHYEWMNRHRRAKLFLEADASLGSERPLKLTTIAPMLRCKSDHRIPFPREDMVHFVEVGDYDGHIGPKDVDKILSVVNNPDLLYAIYVNGAEHMRRYYSLEARSNYVIDHVERLVKNL